MTSRASRSIVAFALVASLLVVSATPAAATHQVVVGSTHTNDSDFNAGTLTNLTVVGTGDAIIAHGVETSGSTVARPDDNQGGSVTSRYGVKIDPKTDLVGLSINLSSNVAGATTAYLTETDGTVLETATISGGTAEFSHSIDANTNYYVVVDAGGSTYTNGRYDNPSFSYTSSDIDITAGVFGGTNEANDNVWNVLNVTAIKTNPTESSEYISANHTAENYTSAGFVNITTLTNATATITWQTTDGGAWSTINQTTGITTAANHSFTWPAEPNSTIRVNVSVFNQTGNGDPEFTMAAEGVKYTPKAPVVDNGSASPTGDLSSDPTSLSIDVSDFDLKTKQGDSVTVEFFLNGTSQGTDTLTANGTASTSITSAVQSGVNGWYAVAEDSIGHSQVSSNFTMSAPANLSVFNETAVRLNDSMTDAELVKNVDVEIRMLQDDGTLLIVTRNTSTGIVDMSGLDPAEPFIAVATADGYYNRRIFIPSLYDSQAIFLLPENQTAVTQEFDLQDFSGLYPQEDTVLEIQRALNGSWRTVEGDYFGATGEFSATLREGARHRLVLTNIETGDTEILGTYTPISSEDKTVKVTDDGQIDLLGVNPTVFFSPDVGALAAESTTIDVTISNESGLEFSSYNATAYLNNETGNFTLATVSGSSATGETLSLAIDLSGQSGNVTVVVNWSTGSSSGGASTVYLIRESFSNQYNLITVLRTIPTYLPAATAGTFLAVLSIFLAVLGVTASASVVRLSTEEAGLVGITILAATAVMGWLDWSVVFAGSIAWLALASRRRGF